MTTLTDRPATALVVVDLQEGVVENAYDKDAVVANVQALVGRARAEDVAVVWVQHHDEELQQGSPQWQLASGLSRQGSEALVEKEFGDSFEGTDLEEVLSSAQVGHLVVAGAQTDMCIRSTIHGAFARGYDVTLVSDAHTTEDLTAWGAPAPDLVIAHTNLYWGGQRGPGRAAATVAAADVVFKAPQSGD